MQSELLAQKTFRQVAWEVEIETFQEQHKARAIITVEYLMCPISVSMTAYVTH
jgi:hypothetical protein